MYIIYNLLDMKVAWCLHGQPRDVLAGHSTIKSFVDKHPSVHFDFFCHTWFSSDPTYMYPVSSWRGIQAIPQGVDTIKSIDILYNPIKHCVEEPIDFDVSDIISSIAVRNVPGYKNIKNTRSNLYSQTKVRDILFDYVNRIDTNYDIVISSRYDLHKEITLDLNTLDNTKIYSSNIHSPLKVLVDHLYIMPMTIFFDILSIYKILHNIIDSSSMEEIFKKNNIGLGYVPESLMTASLHYFNYIDLLVLSPHIPNFH
jgi:hypothetical protein